MPHFTLTLTPAGLPVVDAVVMVSEARRQALIEAGQPVPNPVSIRALVDTGASNTCIDLEVLNTLGLTPTGSVLCNTPTTGAAPQEKNQYDVGFAVPPPNGAWLFRPTLAVMESELFAQQGFRSLLGRDILAGCLLHYNGTTKIFTVAY